MPPGRRHTTEGCWTCRLRRKRCDLMRPICASCQSLQITCHFDNQKPAWMDGAAEQKRMMQKIKNDIKQTALSRRERKNLESKDNGIVFAIARHMRESSPPESGQPPTTVREDPARVPGISEDLTAREILVRSTESVVTGGSSVVRTERSFLPLSVTSEQHEPLIGNQISTHPIKFPSREMRMTSINLSSQVELGFVMIYLDYVFPFLFPFYQPPLLQTGRHWLLSLLCQNEVSFYTAASLSSYFFSVVQDCRQAEESCKDIVWRQLVAQVDKAIKTIQQDINEIDCGDAQNTLMESFHVMGEIIQLLIVDVTVCRIVEWNIHLTPALVLFEDIFKHHGILSSQPNLEALLRRIPTPFPAMASKPLPNSADQSALLFFIATLLFIDIISSTSLERAPRLQDYHLSLLRNDSETEFQISLEDFVGCQNWVLMSIAHISTLDAWKKKSKSAGDLSVVELVNRARPISEALEDGLHKLESNAPSNNFPTTAASRLGAYYSRLEHGASKHASIIIITRIWAHAAKIYLSVIISGWQPASLDVRHSISTILTLLQTIESPAQLRSLAWPLCVAGCLALPQQEQEIRQIVDSMGELGRFGTVTVAQGIMEAVWESRDTFDRHIWDIAACLRILGSPALLI